MDDTDNVHFDTSTIQNYWKGLMTRYNHVLRTGRFAGVPWCPKHLHSFADPAQFLRYASINNTDPYLMVTLYTDEVSISHICYKVQARDTYNERQQGRYAVQYHPEPVLPRHVPALQHMGYSVAEAYEDLYHSWALADHMAPCEACGDPWPDTTMVYCDHCNAAWHKTCLDNRPKKGQHWTCPHCTTFIVAIS